MHADEAKEYIVDNIKVPRQRVTVAKAFILKNFDPNSETLIKSFLDSVDAEMPQQVVLHQSVDAVPTLKQAAEAISWKLAACEAIWGLISSSFLIPASNQFYGDIGGLGWTTVVPGSGGSSSGFSLDELSIRVPSQLVLPRSSHNDLSQPLTDPDLYLKELNLPNLPQEIEEALREAVRCFRYDMYLACLAMLGRASEGAWIELGLGLAKAAPRLGSTSQTKVNKIIQDLESTYIGIARKIQMTVKLYEKQDVVEILSRKSKVKLEDLRNSVTWVDAVRESRNSIHYGVKPSMSNSYEKVGALLIGAVPHIRMLVTLTTAARKATK